MKYIVILKMEKVKNIVKEGNSCIFAMFIIFNFFLFLSSIGILGCSIYLFVLIKDANVFNISFLVISIVLFLFTFLAFRMRKSVHWLGFYVFVLTILFLFQLIITILVMTNKDKMIRWAKEHMSDSEKSLDEVTNELNAHFT